MLHYFPNDAIKPVISDIPANKLQLIVLFEKLGRIKNQILIFLYLRNRFFKIRQKVNYRILYISFC